MRAIIPILLMMCARFLAKKVLSQLEPNKGFDSTFIVNPTPYHYPQIWYETAEAQRTQRTCK